MDCELRSVSVFIYIMPKDIEQNKCSFGITIEYFQTAIKMQYCLALIVSLTSWVVEENCKCNMYNDFFQILNLVLKLAFDIIILFAHAYIKYVCVV